MGMECLGRWIVCVRSIKKGEGNIYVERFIIKICA